MKRCYLVFVVLSSAFLFSPPACRDAVEPILGLKAFVGIRLFDGTGSNPISDAVMVVRNGRIEAAGPADAIEVPAGAEVMNLAGKTVIPGFINSHGHVGATKGLESGPEHYTRKNILDQLSLCARYGVTTVISLGGDGEEGIRIRDVQDSPELQRARLYVAGPVVTSRTPEEARQKVQELAGMGVNLVKIRVDDNLGTTQKMKPEVYQAVIDQAHQEGLRVAAHLFYLEDAKALLRSGVDFIAHSVRDREVDEEFVSLIKEHGVCLCPTLVREVSTFVYENRPPFFDDAFFRRDADPEVIKQLEDPKYQQGIQNNRSAQAYKKALEVASRNLKILADQGVPIAFGTDSGPPARFQGFFEHLETELMAKAGLTPEQILVSATSQAARCLKLDENLGTLEPGKWADFLILEADPLEDIQNARKIHSVWTAGNRIPVP